MIPPGLLPTRPPDTHKGLSGRVLIVAGARGLTGAAALAARGALRTGAGLVTVATPASVYPILAVKLTEAMTKPLPETREQTLSLQAQAPLLEQIGASDCAAIGPGLSQHSETGELVRRLIPLLRTPCVLDADGINAVAADRAALKRRGAPMVITPHPAEMGRLVQLSADDVQRDRERIASEFAKDYGVVVVLKGHRTVIANVDGARVINETGNPGMAAGGMGDVLTGMIAALIGQRLAPFDAARLGVHLHGLAGDLAMKRVGAVGLIATDLADTIPLAVRDYQRGSAASPDAAPV